MAVHYQWTDGNHKDFQVFYQKTEEYYSKIVGGAEKRKAFVPYNASSAIDHVIIAYDRDNAIACAGLKHYSETDAEIKRVWVEPGYRGQHLAQDMMKLLEEKACKEGYQRLILQTREIMTDAVGLYEKIGYQRIDNYPPYDTLFGAVCYEKKISPAELLIELQDTEWPFEYTDHDRRIARAVVFDDDGYFYFVRAERDDDFGRATLIETSGGGIEAGEDPESAIKRELKEELGAEVEVICKIGTVCDYYNLIHRHNLNNYFLCRVISFGDKNLMQDEIEEFHLSTLKLTYEEAVAEYEKRRETKLGRLIANREIPIFHKAQEILRARNGICFTPMEYRTDM